MAEPTRTPWRITGEAIVCCNCAWGCPCQFNANPTHGYCHGMGVWRIREGHYGSTRLDGVTWAGIYWWPGAVHEGNGHRQMVIDTGASGDQREAIVALDSGKMGWGFFEVFAAVAPNVHEPVVAPIVFESDRERRQALTRSEGVFEVRVEPIRNPATGEEHRARINLPGGFEYKEAEVADAVSIRVTAVEPLRYEHQHTHAHLNAFEWSA